MTYEEIFEKTKEIIMSSDVSKIDNNLAVQVDITGEGEGAFYIELKNHELHVEPYEYYDNDCKFIATADNFLKIVDGKLDPTVAFSTGKLKIDGSVEKAIEFKSIIDKIGKQQKSKPSRKTADAAPAEATEAKAADAKAAESKADSKAAAKKAEPKAAAKKTEVKATTAKKTAAK